MNDIDKQTLVQSLKNQIEENDGELGYWGETIRLKSSSSNVLIEDPVSSKDSNRLRRSITNFGNDDKTQRLEILRKETIGDCRLCPLCEARTKIVFGVGNPESKVMFVGEGPGFDEDRIGDPFVGKAGQLLDKIMAAIGLNRSNVYIANIVKCHPMVDPTQPEKRGNDRPPLPSEIEKCLPFLKEQIAIIQPSVIVALGSTAAKVLLRRSDGITKVRGQIFEIELIPGQPPIPVLPTFHPAALLRDETLKKPVWEDMKLLRSIMTN